jgi:probable HAF family extracellular repeat protein
MHAFLWQHGVMIDLLGEQYSYSWANDINPAGQVVGRTDRGAFLWQHGVTRYLPMYDAVAINAGGAVVGYGALGARVWKNGVVTEIGPIGENSCGRVSDINPRGQVVGSHLVRDFGDEFWCHGFLWDNGQLTDLGTLGGDRSAAMAINPAGQVVGYSEGGLVSPEAFLWQNGVMNGLGTLGGGESYAYAITPGGEVLGESSSVSGELHAFLWKNGVMTDLGFSGGPFALHISSKGQIVGTSRGAQCCDHATLWTRK